MTREGQIFGTAAYMSPEQARGQAVDARSDLFSFGTMLYEMVTGQLPFQGPTATDVLSAIIRDEPAPVSKVTAGVPAELERIIAKALQKESGLRYQTARDLIADLKRLQRGPLTDSTMTAPAGGQQATIAVLPFENLSPDPDNAFFADGLTEELIADLAKVRALRVISRTSAMHYKGTTKRVPEIARELNVSYVIEGSVRRAAKTLRITAQLIDATTDTHVWAEKYNGGLEDVFELQERLSRRIVDALRVRLAPEEERRLGARPTRDPRVYEVWLRAKHQARFFTKEGTDGAIALVNQGIAMVGESALFNATLAYLYWGSYDSGFGHGEETLARIETHARKALTLDPDLPQALLAMGVARYKHGDLQGLVRYARRTVQIERDSDALALLGFVLADVGKTQEARPCVEEARARDPFSPLACLSGVFVDIVDGAFDEAFARCQDSADRLAPGDPLMLWWTGHAAMQAGRDDEARAAFGCVLKGEPGFWAEMSELGSSALGEDRAAVRRVLGTTTLTRVAKTDEYYPVFLASCLARVGETESALEWIRQAVTWGFANHRFLSMHNRFFAPLRDDPRFQALVATAREKERAFEV
ncbi:MAG TPA: protein kinase [Candidatus Polarisedimenticolia bacterium]|nr:protein kinase [Candidatus Polarisedimenticolia bacterium]